MKSKSIILSVVVAAQMIGCSHKTDEPPGASASEKEKSPESRVKHGSTGEVVITLDGATQKTIGLQVAALAPAQLPPSIKSYGRVLETAQFASQVADLVVAMATKEASQHELQRLKTLAGQNNTSQRALQAAEAAAIRDETQAQAAHLHLISTWGSVLASRTDLPALAQSFASLSNALVQLNLPASQTLRSPPLGARIQTLSTNAASIEAQFAGEAPKVDAQFQSQGFFFLVSSNASKLTPGAAVSGFITLAGEPRVGVLLPREAIVRFNGTTWVYRQTSEETFTRIEARLEETLPSGWFASENLKPEDKVVVTGAQMLLSEELKGQIEE